MWQSYHCKHGQIYLLINCLLWKSNSDRWDLWNHADYTPSRGRWWELGTSVTSWNLRRPVITSLWALTCTQKHCITDSFWSKPTHKQLVVLSKNSQRIYLNCCVITYIFLLCATNVLSKCNRRQTKTTRWLVTRIVASARQCRTTEWANTRFRSWMA